MVAEPGEAVADVGVTDGVIAAVAPGLAGSGATEIDAAGLHVFPGGIDPHVHFDEPGRTGWEGFASGTAALAAGGYTAYVDMPLNSTPPLVDAAAFDLKLAAARAGSCLDFGLWAGLVPGSEGAMEELAGRGVLGFKAFMCDSGIDDFPAAGDLTLWRGMARAAELDLPVLVHAENRELVGRLAAQAQAAGRTSGLDYARARPAIAELEAIGRALAFAGETGCAVHVVHVSTQRGVRLVADARRQGVDASCETCPHYLLYTEDDLAELGVAAKCAPPLRGAGDREGLWADLAAGDLPMVASDHSPGPPQLKAGTDFFAAWGGITGCQTSRPSLLAAAGREGVSDRLIAAVTAANVADRFRLAGKGRVAPGFDADLALVDLGRTWTLTAEELLYRHRISAHVGRPMRGWTVQTLRRGRPVFAAGRPQPAGPPRLLRPDLRREPLTDGEDL